MDFSRGLVADWDRRGGIMRKILIMLILSVLVGSVAVGGATSESISTHDEFVEAVALLSDLLDRATYLAITGFSAYDAEDQRVAAQELVNLFEGPGGPNYKSQTDGVAQEDELGILASFEHQKNANITDLFEGFSYSQFFVFRDVSWNTEHFLRLSYVSALEALRIAYSLIGPKDAFRTSYAFLLAAKGGFDDPFLVAGVQSLRNLLPSTEVRALQDDSIQAAIDVLPDGGTLQLESGVYRERLIITKSVTIVGAQQGDDETRADGGTVLEGVAWEPVVSVISDEPVIILLENLVIRGGSTAIGSWLTLSQPNVTLTLKNVTFLENGTGLVLGKGTLATCTNCRFKNNDFAVRALAPEEGAQANFTNCVFDGNESVIEAWGNQTITLDRCVLQNGTDPDGDISLAGAASLEMRNSELHRVAGRGIVLMDTVSLMLVDSVIETADSYAIAVARTDARPSDQTEQDCGVFLGRNDTELPLGTIAGYGNTISGGVCPTSLLFLTEPAQTEISVAPGQSIQAAIDLVADGGVVTIGAGTYLEAITIDKSLSLISAVGDSGDVILDWDVEGTVISISSSVPIDVALSGLTFQGAGAGWAIDVGENATVGMQNMTFHDLGTATQVHDGGSVTASHCLFTGNGSTIVLGPNGHFTGSWCSFSDNRQAIMSAWSSACTLTDSEIIGCTGDGEAISVHCTDLELRSCTIRDSVGSAIHLGGGEATKLHIINSSLTGNAYGIDFTYGSCNPGDDPDWDAPQPSARSYATVTGWNNHIPGPDEPDGNREGAFWYCFPDRLVDPSFLAEPKSEDE